MQMFYAMNSVELGDQVFEKKVAQNVTEKAINSQKNKMETETNGSVSNLPGFHGSNYI